MKEIDVMITAFRDGFQSAYGARVCTEDYLPALEAAAYAGFHHFEIGGGARFQSLYFYCNEDAFDMMDASRRVVGPDANLQTLARGVNVVGLDSQSSDIIDLHAKLFKKHGVTTIRNFDALNDIENLDFSGKAIHNAGLKHEITVTLMGLPPGLTGAHDAEFYTSKLQEIIDSDIPFDSVCYKDASGTTPPSVVYDSIREARRILPSDIPIRFHTHETAGTSVICYKAALDAGARGIDLSLAPVSGGTSQPDVVAMWQALRGSEYDLGFDLEKVMEVEAILKDHMKDYFLPPEASIVEPMIPFSPMPGGALTANTQMMRDAGMLEKFPEVIAAMGEVVRLGGFGTSVTPVSQFYFQQAFNNVMFGPWKKIAEGYGKMVLGYFGHTPLEPDPEIVRIAEEQMGLPPTRESARMINDRDPKKGRQSAEAQLKQEGIGVTDENVFIAATCLDKGITFLKGDATRNIRKNVPTAEGRVDDGKAQSESSNSSAPVGAPDGTTPAATSGTAVGAAGARRITVQVKGKTYDVAVTETVGVPASVRKAIQAVEPPKSSSVSAAANVAPPSQSTTSPAPAGSAPTSGRTSAPLKQPAGVATTKVEAPMPGTILRIDVTPGTSVKEGTCLLILEAMKMETEIFAPVSGTVQGVHVAVGDRASSGQALVEIVPA